MISIRLWACINEGENGKGSKENETKMGCGQDNRLRAGATNMA